MIVPRVSPACETIATILSLVGRELGRDTIGSQIVSARLADVLVVQAIRAYAEHAGHTAMGWLGALADPRLGRALRAMHDDVAQPWTVARLASVAGMSRAAFAAAFTRQMGQPALAYLRAWRLTIARAALLRGDAPVGVVASRVGY